MVNLKRILPTYRTSVLLLSLLGCWLLISYLVVSSIITQRYHDDLQRHAAELQKTASAVTYHIERSFTFLHVIPATLADDLAVINALRTLPGNSLPRMASPEERRDYLSSRQEFMALNRHLATQQRDFGVDVIWALAPNGDCIASSNFEQAESFVGINYADRSYFTSAMAGKKGQQFAVGRQTSVPGFYFSAPVIEGERVLGVVTVKIATTKLSQWFNRFNCFVTDASGVVILASDPVLNLCALPDSPIFRMTQQERERQYKKSSFTVLKFDSIGEAPAAYTTMTLPGSSGACLVVKSKPNRDGYTIHSYVRLEGRDRLRSATREFTSLLFISGTAIILLIAGVRRYLLDMRAAIGMA